jgi:hypothetical protein
MGRTTKKQEYFKNDQTHTHVVSLSSALRKSQSTEILGRLSKIYVKISNLQETIWFVHICPCSLFIRASSHNAEEFISQHCESYVGIFIGPLFVCVSTLIATALSVGQTV